jgi:hypothetical protein
MIKNIVFVFVLFISLNAFADGCSGAATFIATYDSTQCCWSFQNTTNNDCMQWNCSWDFGDGSPIVTTPQGQGTTCHSYANPGTYTVTLIFDSSPCHGGGGGICYGNQNVTIPPLSISSTESDYNGYNVSCEGANDGWISMNSATTYTYEWPATNNTPWNVSQFGPNVNNLTAGTYTVFATSNGCTGNLTITLIEPNLDGVATINNATCFGYNDGSIDFTPIDGLPPFQYNWSNTSIAEDPIALIASTYYLLLTDSFGCTETFQYQVSEPSQLNVLSSVSLINGSNITCNGGQDGFIDLTVSGSVPTYNYQWSNGENTEDLNNLDAGVYSYMVTDQNGCIFEDSLEIIEPELYVIETIQEVSCYSAADGSANISVSGSSAPYYVFWDNNINPGMLYAGSYSYTIIDSLGCSYYQTVYINEPDSFNVSVSITDVICHGESNGSVSLSVNGGIPPYSYNWFSYDTLNMIAGSYNYTIADSNNCTFSGIAVVNQPNLIDVLNYVIDPSCNNTSDGSVVLQISGGNSPYSVDWGGSNPDSLSLGTHQFIVTDINNCIDSNLVTLSSESNISINTTVNDITCRGFCDGSVDLIINGGIAPYSINWFGLDPTFLCEGVVHFEVIDSIGCHYLDTVEFIAPDSVGLQINQIGLQLEATAIGGTPPYQFEWFDNNGSISSNQTIPIINNGYYYCVAIDQNNCQSDTISFNYSDVGIYNEVNGTFRIYPNPSDNEFVIEFNLDSRSRLKIYLINALGQHILLDKHDGFVGEYVKSVDVTKKSSGVYILNLIIDDTSYYHKIIIK